MAKKQTLAQRIAADPALKAKYLANPGLRSKLPDSALTPAQRKVRQANAFNAAPITEGSTVTNKQLAQEAANATQLRYGQQEQALGAQQQRAQSLGRDQNDWYAAYRAELAQHASNAQQIGAAAVAQDAQLAQGARGLDQSQSDAQLKQMQADAATRGGTVDPSLAQTASNASAVRQQMLAGFGSQQAATGAAHSQYADTLAHVVAPAQQLQAQAQASNRVQDILNQITALQGDKGAYNQSYRTGRVADEQKTVLSKQALGLDVQKAQSAADLGAARVKETHRATTVRQRTADANRQAQLNSPSAQKTAQEVAYFNKHGHYPSTGASNGAKGKVVKPTSGPGSINAGAESKIVSQVNTVAGLIKSSPKVDDKGQPLTDAQIRAHLLNGTNPTGKPIDPTIVNLAFDLARKGGLSPANVTAAHNQLNIHVAKHFKILPRAKATLRPGQVTGGGPNGDGT